MDLPVTLGSELMSYFMFTLAVMLVCFSGMALGVILSHKPLKGSCGGLGAIMGEKCAFCEKQGECRKRQS